MADYLPITDLEIEPEAPITSALQHKFRENPLAMFEGAAGAPQIQSEAYGNNSIPARAWNIDTQFSTTSGRINFAGGIYMWNFQIGSTGGSRLVKIHFNLNDTADVPLGNWRYTENIGQSVNYNASYFVDPATLAEDSFLYILREISTGDFVGFSFVPTHISYGFDYLREHPFDGLDLTGLEIFLITITPEQKQYLEIANIPIVGGGYLSQEILDDNTPYNIDYTRPWRNILDSFFAYYSVSDFTAISWMTEEFTVLRPMAHTFGEFPKILLPQPPDVTRIGVTLI